MSLNSEQTEVPDTNHEFSELTSDEIRAEVR